MHEFLRDMIDRGIEQIEKAIPSLPPSECPRLMGDLERLKIMAGRRLYSAEHQSDSMAEPAEKLLDMNQVAEHLNIPISRVRELSRRKDGFPVRHIGKYVRVKPSELWQWVESLQKKGLDNRLDHRYTIKYERKRTQAPSYKNGNHSSGVR